MKNLITSMLIVGLACITGGCDKKAAEPAKPAGATGTTAANTAPDAAKPAEAAKPAATKPASTATQATADGAMQLFVDSIRNGDFATAASVCDPASQGFKQVNDIADALQIARENDSKGKGDPVTPMLLNFFTGPYKNASFKKVTEQDVRARYELSLAGDAQALPVDLSLVNGKWYLIAPENILKGDKSTLPAIQAPEPTPPAPTPAPAPAPASEPAPAPAPAPQN